MPKIKEKNINCPLEKTLNGFMPNSKSLLLKKLSDSAGRFKMLAIDQRGSLRKKLASASGQKENQIKSSDLKIIKKIIIKTLAPYATAILTDPEYGLSAIKYIPQTAGLLLCVEESGFKIINNERWTKILPNWSAAKIKKLGASAAKLLLYYNPQASQKCLKHQQKLARQIGAECQKAGLPFLLELLTYSLDNKITTPCYKTVTSKKQEEQKSFLSFVEEQPNLVIQSAREFSKTKYQVDILKLEFPVNLKFVKEYQFLNTDNTAKTTHQTHTLKDVRKYLILLNQASLKPWVILSAGASIAEFLIEEELALKAGASGFLCGRAVWQDALRFYPNIGKIAQALKQEGIKNLQECNRLVEKNF